MSVELLKCVNQQINTIRRWMRQHERVSAETRIILKLMALVEHMKVELERKDA